MDAKVSTPAARSAMPSPAPKRLPPLLRHAWYGLNQGFRQRIAHLELTPDQFSILRGLSEGDPEGLTQRAISDLMASDPNTITSTLSRMENAGLITRHPPRIGPARPSRANLPQGETALRQSQKAGKIPGEPGDDSRSVRPRHGEAAKERQAGRQGTQSGN